MKICFLADGSQTGGVFTRKWINHFVKRHEVSLVTFNKPSDISELVDVHYIPRIENVKFGKLASFPSFVLKFRKLIKKINPDILYAHYILHYGFSGALSGFHPFGISPLGSDIATVPDKSRIFKFATTFTIKKADFIQVQDLLSAKRVIELGADKRKVFLTPWGVDLERFRPQRREKEYDIINIRGYNIETFIRAISIVKDKHPNVKVILLGAKEDKHLINLLNKFNVSKNIRLGGFVNNQEIPEYLSKSKIFVDAFYRTHNKGGHSYGVALHEAMACGVPTIVANRPDIYRLKGKYKWYFGQTFEGDNPNDLAKKLINLLENEKEKKRISNKNRKIIEKQFDFNKNMEKIEKELEKIIKNYK